MGMPIHEAPACDGDSARIGDDAPPAPNKKLKADVANAAEGASADAYEDMPIGEFGKAMLRGMGWEEGVGINGKEVVEPIEYVARSQLLGLGATPQKEETSAAAMCKVGAVG